jgi:hypothetical protein
VIAMTLDRKSAQRHDVSVAARIDAMDEAAGLLAAQRPDLAEACEFAASLLREETEPIAADPAAGDPAATGPEDISA